MRKWCYALAASLLAFGLSGQAHAVTLGFMGSLAVQIDTLDPVQIPGAGYAIVNGDGEPDHPSGLQVPASLFAVTAFIVPVTDPTAFPINGVQVTARNGEGNFGGAVGAGFSNIMPVLGAAKVCLFGTCSNPVANLNVPLSVVGAGGNAYVVGAVNLTVVGAPWTTGTAAVGNDTIQGGVEPLSNTGAPSGTARLVTPIFISTNIGASSVVPAFGILTLQFVSEPLTLQFVPEPGTLLLLGSGIAGLVAYGRNRARS